MTDRIRVRIVGPGHELTIGQDQYDAQPDAFEIVDKPAVDGGGVDVPTKYKTSARKSAESKKAASPASSTSPSTGSDEKAESTATTKEI